jgi:hypothetical protein
MNDVAKEVEAAANEVLPNSPLVEAASAILNTVENPSPENIIADVELAISLVKQVKAHLDGVHPSLLELLKALL